MTDGVHIEVTGIAETRARFKRLMDRAPRIADKALEKFAKYARRFLKAKGEPGKNRRPMRWVSEKQRRYVMAAIRSGEIDVPYKRTGKLPSSYSARRESLGRWAVGNSQSYARFAVGDAEGKGQYWMHQYRWYKFRTQLFKLLPKLTQFAREALANE